MTDRRGTGQSPFVRGCIKFDATSFFVDKTAKFNRAISGRQGNSLSDLALQKYYESFMKRR